LLQAAFQARVVVPDQLSIVGFDDIDIAQFTIPPLTTISQAGVEMGRTSAHLLLDMIEGRVARADVEDVIVAPSLVVRQSTAPAPG
jgi:LacI family transcriptional regulator